MEFTHIQLPKEWRIARVREVYSFTKKPRGLSIANDAFVPFLPMNTIPLNRLHVSDHEERCGALLTSGTYIEKGDLLVAKITPSFENGKQAIVDWQHAFGFATTEVIPIQELDGISDKYFLFYILLHPAIRSDLAGKMDGTTGRQRLSKAVLGSRLIPFPPLSEQRKIAAVLGIVQQAIEQQKRLLTLTTELKKTLLNQLFTYGLRNEPQKQTEIGLMPESWEVVELEKIAVTFDYGTSVKCDYKQKAAPVLRIPNIANGFVDLSDLKYGQPKQRELKSLKLCNGDLLFVRTNGVQENAGRCALFRDELPNCYFASYLIRVRTDSNRLLPAFLNHYVQTERGKSYLAGRAVRTADGKFNINSGTLRRVVLPLPSLAEQREIVYQLSFAEKKQQIHHRKYTALTALFRTMLHELMTAKIRVNKLSFDGYLEHAER